MAKFIINDVELDSGPIDIMTSRKRYSSRVNIFSGKTQTVMSTNMGTNRSTVLLVFNEEDRVDMGNFVKLMSRLSQYPFAFIKSHQLFRQQIAEGDAFAGHPYKPIGDNFHMYGVEEIKIQQDVTAQGIIFLELSLIFFNYIPFAHSLSFIARRNFSRLSTEINNHIKTTTIKPKTSYYEVDSPAQSDLYTAFFNDDWAIIHGNINGIDSNKALYIKAPFMDTGLPAEGVDYREVKVMKDFAEDTDKNIADLFEVQYVSWLNVNNLTGNANFNNEVTPVQSITISKRFRFAETNLAAWQKPILQYLGEGDITLDVTFKINHEYSNGLGEFDPLHQINFLTNKLDSNFASNPKLQIFNHLKVDQFLTNAINHFDFIIDRDSTVFSSQEQGASTHRCVMLGVQPEYFANIGKYFQAGTKQSFFNEIGGDELLIAFYEEMQSMRKIRKWNASKTNVFSYVTPNPESSSIRSSDETIDLGEAQEIYRALSALCDSNNVDPNGVNAMNELIYLARSKANQDERLMLRLQSVYMKLIKLHSTPSTDFNRLLVQHKKRVWDGQGVVIGKFRGEAYNDFNLARKAGIQPDSIANIQKIGRLSPFLFLRKSQYITEPQLTAQYAEFLDWESSQSLKILASVAKQWAQRNNVEIDNLTNTAAELEDTGYEYDSQKIDSATSREPESIFNFSGLLGKSKLYGMEQVVPSDRALAYNEDLAAVLQLENMAGPYEDALKQAFPVIKVYLVRQFDSEIAFTDIPVPQYFELKGIGNVNVVTPTDENPVGVATLEISNPGNIYTHKMDIFSNNQPKINPELRNTEDAFDIKIDQIQLQVGHMIHIRAGYSNDINQLETIFNGQITSIDGSETLQLIAETYGRELIACEHGDDPDEDNFWFHQDTESVIGEALAQDEIENFGETVWDFNPFNGLREKDAQAQRLQFLRSRIYMNVFAQAIEEVDDVFQGIWNTTTATFIPNQTAFYQFSIYKTTPWEMLKEMQQRHPNTLSKAMNYGHRATFVFGIKEQLYLAKDLAKELMDESFYDTPFFDAFGDEEQARKYQNKIEALRYKPVSSVHMCTSETNIVFNNLTVTDNFNTVVRVAYYEDQEDIKDSEYKYMTMQMDDNLRASSLRMGEVYGGGIHKQFMAYRYGVEYLRSEAEKMYDGTVRLIGNARIKAGDYLYIHDNTRGLHGMVKVREAVHIFDSQFGFVTDVTPGLFVEANEVTYSQLFQRLMGTAMASCANMNSRVIEKYGQGAEYNLVDMAMRLVGIQNKKLSDVEKELYQNYGLGAANATFYGGISYSGLSSLYRMMGYQANGNIISQALMQGKNSIAKLAEYAKTTNVKAFAGIGGISRAAWSATKTIAIATGQLAKLDAVAAARTLGGAIKFRPMISTAFSGLRLAVGGGAAVAASLTGPGALAFLAVYGIGTIAVEALTQTILFGLKTRQPVRIYPIKLNGVQYTGGIVGYKDNDLLESFMDEFQKTTTDLGRIVNYITADAQVDI